MKHYVKNFTDRDTLEISHSLHRDEPLVHIICREGSLNFQHSMTTDQARAMASYLLTSAYAAEEIAPGELV